MKRLVCFFRGHRWLYYHKNNRDTMRQCQRCGKVTFPTDWWGY